MVRLSCRRYHLPALLLLTILIPLALNAMQDQPKRGRKYNPPPKTCKISITVIKATNEKPIENAAVVFHPMEGDKDKGNLELKTNEEGKAVIDVIPIGDTVRLQVIANGYQTFGDDYKIDSDSKEIIVKLKRPGRQYSIYEKHDDAGTGQTSPNEGTTPPPVADKPKQ
jgi:hypothetical protein